ELVAIFGNFVNRTFVLMHKLCGGKVPKLHEDVLDGADRTLMGEIKYAKVKVENAIEEFHFRDALFEVIDLARKGNKYLQEKEPWKKSSGEQGASQENQNLIDNCLHLCLQLTANLTILINPFLPVTAKKMLHMMKVVDKMLDWGNAGKIKLLSIGYSLRPPELLFRKVEDEEIKAQVEKLKANANKALSPKPKAASDNEEKSQIKNLKSQIQYDDFA